MPPPDLHVDELRVRPWQVDDADAVFRACQDPALHRWLTGLPWPYSRADAVEFVGDKAPRMLADGDAMHLGVFDERGLVGSVALHKIDRVRGTAEIGYWSAPWARGRRVAERAARALLSWGFEALELRRVDWRATVGNHASRLTALRLGFRMVGTWPAPDRWLGSLTREDLREADAGLPDSVRRSALTFSGAQPVLEAGTLTLRRPAERDLPGVVECHNDPEVARGFGVARPWTHADGLRYVTVEVPGRWTGGEEAVFAVVGPDDAYQGSVDLRILGTDPAAGEVGFFVAPRSRGRGQATTALTAVCGWGFEALGLERIQWRAEVGNQASRRVAEKAGFTMEGLLRQALVIDGVRRDCWIGSLLRKDVA